MLMGKWNVSVTCFRDEYEMKRNCFCLTCFSRKCAQFRITTNNAKDLHQTFGLYYFIDSRLHILTYTIPNSIQAYRKVYRKFLNDLPPTAQLFLEVSFCLQKKSFYVFFVCTSGQHTELCREQNLNCDLN